MKITITSEKRANLIFNLTSAHSQLNPVQNSIKSAPVKPSRRFFELGNNFVRGDVKK